MAWSRSKPKRQSCLLLAPVTQIEENPWNTHSLNGIPLLLGHGNSLSTRRQGGVVITILAEQAEKLVGVLGNQVGELGVASTQLLQNRLQHLRLLLDNLTKLLKLWVVSQEVQVAKSLPGGGGSRSSRGSSHSGSRAGSASAGSTSTTASLLSSQVEQIHAVITTTRSRGCGRGRRSGRLSGLCGLLFLLQILRDTLISRQPHVSTIWSPRSCAHGQKVLDGAIWVVESGAHGGVNLGSLKAHRLHVRDGLGTLAAQGQGVGVVVGGIRAPCCRGGRGWCGGGGRG